MKKVFIAFISLMALLLVPASGNAQSATTRVWIDDNQEFVADGKTINWLTLYENDPEVDYVAFNVEILLPKGLTIARVKEGRNMVDQVKLTERGNEGHSLSFALNTLDDNEVYNDLKIACISLQNYQFYPDDADGNPIDALVRIGLIADPSMEAGNVELRLKDACFVYEDAHYATYLNGEFLTATASVVKPMSIDYTMTAACAGTLIVPFDCEVPNGLTVSTCPSVDANNYVLQEKAASIKANTPYLVEGTPGTYTLTGNAGAVDATKTYQEGVLVGVLQETQPPVGSYLLQNQNGHVAFYLYGEANTRKLAPYRCYLALPTPSANVRAVYIDSLTGIHGARADAKVNVYSTDGQLVRSRVQAAKALDGLAAGIYIVNGVKHVKTAK